MLVKKVIINSLNEASMIRILMILENTQQVSFWIGEQMRAEDIIENLLSATNDIVRKSQENKDEPSQSQGT